MSNRGGLTRSAGAGDRPDYKPQVPEMYKAVLEVERAGAPHLRITTNLPENYTLDLATSWNNPFDQPLSDLLGGAQMVNGASEALKATSGQTTQHKWLSSAVWAQGSVLTVTIPFKFVAYTDAREDVLLKVRQLMELVCPRMGSGGLLVAPGPRMNPDLGNWQRPNGDYIRLRIGTHFVMEPCVVESVAQSLDTQYDQNGIPISAAVDVTVKSYFTVTQEDIQKWYSGGLGGGF